MFESGQSVATSILAFPPPGSIFSCLQRYGWLAGNQNHLIGQRNNGPDIESRTSNSYNALLILSLVGDI